MKNDYNQTRREQKHDMYLTFMANTTPRKSRPKPAQARPRLLKTLLSLFM